MAQNNFDEIYRNFASKIKMLNKQFIETISNLLKKKDSNEVDNIRAQIKGKIK